MLASNAIFILNFIVELRRIKQTPDLRGKSVTLLVHIAFVDD